MLMRHDFLTQEYNAEITKNQIDSEGYLRWNDERQQYIDAINTMRSSLDRDPYVLVLIDGDGMIFQDDYFRAGEAGGRDAANKLHAAISSQIHRELKIVPVDSEIVCVVYANVKGLAEVLVRTGVVEDINIVEDFVRGFTRGQTTFDFIDVGPGKDRADEKLIRTFKRNVGIFQCRKIYFGCSHDNGYARVLEDHAANNVYLEKVLLLEGVPFEKELLQLPFLTTKVSDLFRDKKISVWSPPSVANVTPPVQKSYNMLSGLPTRFPSPPRQATRSPVDALGLLPRTPSTSALAVDEAQNKPSTWATRAAVAATVVVSETPYYKPAECEENIARNRHGQRVDPPCREYDKAEVDRIKRMKMCNVHFLRQGCQFGDNCTHRHDYTPTPSEISFLRLVARMAPCVYGGGCQDIKCIYGHRCPAPVSKDGVKGTKSCIFGENCKFPIELHNLDCNVVKTVVIR